MGRGEGAPVKTCVGTWTGSKCCPVPRGSAREQASTCLPEVRIVPPGWRRRHREKVMAIRLHHDHPHVAYVFSKWAKFADLSPRPFPRLEGSRRVSLEAATQSADPLPMTEERRAALERLFSRIGDVTTLPAAAHKAL